MYLGRDLVDEAGTRHPMAGVLPFRSAMGAPRVTLGYRTATARRTSPLLPAGRAVRGHEHHWSIPQGPVPEETAAYDLAGADGRPMGAEGFVWGPGGNVLATYLHLHFGADPHLAPGFVAACAGVGAS
jgi:cobyrinic acid a,c-diamide synthase